MPLTVQAQKKRKSDSGPKKKKRLQRSIGSFLSLPVRAKTTPCQTHSEGRQRKSWNRNLRIPLQGQFERSGSAPASVMLVDDSICPSCRGTTYVGQTIMCEKCQRWFHFGCVGVKDTDPCVVEEDAPYFCPECTRKKDKAKSKLEKAKAKAKAKVVAKAATVSTPGSSHIKVKIGSPKKAGRSPQSLLAPRPPPSQSVSAPPPPPQPSSPSVLGPSSKRKRRQSEVEEERWLDAVEAGEDVNKMVDPELRSIKDPKLMTARQRACLAEPSGGDQQLEESGHMALDYGYKKKAEETELSLRMKALKSAKRKEIEAEKREQDKQKTMDRLLKKKDSKDSKAGKAKALGKSVSNEPKVTYRRTADGEARIELPPGVDFPMAPQLPRSPTKPLTCVVPECGRPKKYNCSKSGRPVCSMECYKKNRELLVGAAK